MNDERNKRKQQQMQWLIYESLFRQKQTVKKNKQTRKNKDKYIAREIYDTIPAATLRIHYGNRND